MPVYRISDVNFKILPKSGYAKRHLQPYIVNDDNFDLEIVINNSDIEFEKTFVQECSFGMCESTAILRKISKKLSNQFDSFLLHSAAIKYKNKAYLFTAPSGTGKTTHIMLWKKLFKNEVEVINGDKPFVRSSKDKFIVYGSPWNGKECMGCNTSAELGGIFVVCRSKENSVEKISPMQALPMLMRQTPLSFVREDAERLLDWFDKLLKSVPVFVLNCNMDDDAAKIAKACTEELSV